MKVAIIITGCILVGVATADLSGSMIGICLALGGVSDFTIAISACIVNCIKNG